MANPWEMNWGSKPKESANPWEMDWKADAAREPDAPKPKSALPRVGGQKVLDYTNETLSNIPSSAGRLVGNIASAIAHPIDTVGALGKVATGTLQNMTPGYVTPERPGFSAEANAAGQALKERYGSPSAIAETIKTDPVGAASDASAVLGGVSGAARGASAVANAVRAPRVAGVAADIAKGTATASDIANPLTLPLKAAGAASKGVARPLVKSALGLPGKTERYGATPAVVALEETKGIRPATIKASAAAKLDDLNRQLEALAGASGNTADLTAARQVIADEIAKVKAANGLVDDIVPMEKQLTDPRPGFAGATEYPAGANTPIALAAGASGAPLPMIKGKAPSKVISAEQTPLDLLKMKRQFGEDFTKFDAAVPLKDSARKVGNKAYHELASEFNRTVPEAKDINQRMQSLIPVRDAAQRTEERAGVVQRGVDRATRPTGAMAPAIAGGIAGGLPGVVAAMTVQEALASPSVRMALARALYGSGKAVGKSSVRRAGNTAGFAGSAAGSTKRRRDSTGLGDVGALPQ